MKVFVAAAVLFCAGLLTTPAAHAQTAPASRDDQAQRANEEGLRKKRKSSPADVAQMQRRMSMNPDEVKRDQQQEILDARAGISSTTYAAGSSAGRQYEKGSGGFTVTRFRNKQNAALQKRGQTRPAPGADPKGKPLKHKSHKKKHFLFF